MEEDKDRESQEDDEDVENEEDAEESIPRKLSCMTLAGEHKLRTPWTFHFDKKLAKATETDFKKYAQNLQVLGKFDTLEGFWRQYSYLQSPDSIPGGTE